MAYVARATDLLSESEARAAASSGTYAPDDELTLSIMVGAITERVEDLCGPVVQRLVSNETHTNVRSSQIVLRQGPITAVTLVEEGLTVIPAEVWGVSSSCYRIEPGRTLSAAGSGILTRRQASQNVSWAPNVRVTYIAGRCATTALVPTDIKEAAIIAIKNVWSSQSAGTIEVGEFTMPTPRFPRYDLPPSAVSMLGRERLLRGQA
jgi:hypothetical protein